ncbi:hypothetical protein RI129_010201 [Pyrocoelia pectoralis]|uniref:Poly(A)-specific ribonuclease RNA-binding domain-containing protein n=1 Tax=Pyrocoelia pectoralis TaxID=417401 RepID=A0AAN7VD06_9COLE
MEVTRTNFPQLLPKIKEAISKCDFIVIDCELTGLNTINNINAFDTQKQYYEKVRRNSKDFLIIQYGLCMFRYDKEKEMYKQQGYNFYIFQNSPNKYVPDHRFLCQSSSIDFLATSGFDFNKLFREGISFLNSSEEEKYRESLSEAQKMRTNKMLQNTYTPDRSGQSINQSMTVEEKDLVNKIFKEIHDFIASDEEEHVLPKCNAYIRRLVYQQAEVTLLNKANLETRTLENKERIFVVTRIRTQDEKEAANREAIKKEEEELQQSIGFSTVIKAIVESGKLLVGHNMCLDLLHTINQFLIPLPFEYEEFKEIAHYSFPKILDTKYMSSTAPLKNLIDSTVVAHLLSTIQREPFKIPTIEIEENAEGYNLEHSKQHEAGYDAYITGLSFLAMWNYLDSLEEKPKKNCFPNFSLLEPYLNRLFLMRLQDYPYINLGGADVVPSRDHIVYLSFPKSWKQNDIFQLFSPFGNIFVAWINDHSAFVALQRRDQISIVLSTLSQSETYTIMSYSQRQAQLAADIITTPSPCQRKRAANNINSSIKKRKTSVGEVTVEKDFKMASRPITEKSKETPAKKRLQNTFEESVDWE